MTIIMAEAIASHSVIRRLLRRASHAPARVEAQTSNTAAQASCRAGCPSSTGSMACAQADGDIDDHLW
ncbi:hypothetical protein GCM10023193_07700 [Planotetraspora kaengkrachanensis]